MNSPMFVRLCLTQYFRARRARTVDRYGISGSDVRNSGNLHTEAVAVHGQPSAGGLGDPGLF